MALVALGAASPAIGSDTTAPTITSVVVTPSLVAANDTVHVAVAATDDVAVTSVTADAVALENTSGSTWEGDVLVNPAVGGHSVTVVAKDAAGNPTQNTSGSYTTRQVFGTSNDSLRESSVIPASSEYLFKVWGRATYSDENTFQVSDGGTYSTQVISPGHGICNNDFVTVRGVLDVAVPPAKLSGVKYLIIEAAPRQQMTIEDVMVGKDLQASSPNGYLPQAIPYGPSLPVTIMSSDPTKVLLAKTTTAPGTESIIVYVAGGSSAIPTFYVHGLADSGVVDVVATAPGCLGKTFKANLKPSGFCLYDPSNNFSTTTLSNNTQLDVRAVRLNPSLTFAAWARLRGGISVEVPVTSSDQAVGTITTSPAVITATTYPYYTAFHPVGDGTATVALTTPAGFSTPTSRQQFVATVSAPDVISADETVGLDLQVQASMHLEAAPPSPVDVVVSVDDPTKATLTIDPTAVGTSSITISGVGDAVTKYFWVQGRALGTTTMRITADGYTTAAKTITINPSGFAIMSPSAINTDSFAVNRAVDVRPVCLNANLSYKQSQRLRGGKSVDVVVTSSNPAVGTIAVSPITYVGNTYSVDAAFDPIGPGTSTIAVVTPAGFTTPTNYVQITATVTASDVLGSVETVGVDLQTTSTVHLEGVPPSPVDVVVTVANPSIATVSSDPLTAGSGSVAFTGVSTTGNKTFYVQGRALGATTMSLSATGYNTKTYTVTVNPSGFYIYSSTAFRTTLYSANTTVTLRSARLAPGTLAYAANQPVRGGLTVNVPLISSNTAVGVVTVSPVVFASNVSQAITAFDPLSGGLTNLSLTTPAGFSTMPVDQVAVATVEAALVVGQHETIGKDLQTSSSVSLEATPPSAVDIVVTVGDPSKAVISTSSTAAGSSTITFTNVGNTAGKTFYVQGLAVGTTTITATANGYQTSVRTVTIDPSGFVISSPTSITTTAGAGNTSVQIAASRLNASTLQWVAYQAVRGGFTASVPVTSSNAAAGVVTISPAVFNGNVAYVTTAFDPLAAGTTVISAEPPSGFSTPTTKRQINATVNP